MKRIPIPLPRMYPPTPPLIQYGKLGVLSVGIANFLSPGLPYIGYSRWVQVRVHDRYSRNVHPYVYVNSRPNWTREGNEQWSTNRYGVGGLIVHYVLGEKGEY